MPAWAVKHVEEMGRGFDQRWTASSATVPATYTYTWLSSRCGTTPTATQNRTKRPLQLDCHGRGTFFQLLAGMSSTIEAWKKLQRERAREGVPEHGALSFRQAHTLARTDVLEAGR